MIAGIEINYWLLLEREFGLRYGADIKIVAGVRQIGDFSQEFRELEYDGQRFRSARHLYEQKSEEKRLASRPRLTASDHRAFPNGRW